MRLTSWPALVTQERNYRLVRPSKNTVASTVKRSRTIPLALMMLSLAGAPAWAQGVSDTAAARYAADSMPQTLRACKDIAALADRGAHALHAADLLGRDVPIDLRNDSHPQKIVRTVQGTAAIPLLTDQTGKEITYGSRDDYPAGPGRLALEIAVVRVDGRVWEVAWEDGKLDGTANLQAATDGGAVCRFHVAFRPPMFKMLSGGKRREADIYRALLLGHGKPPSPAGLDAKAVDAVSDLNRPYTGATYTVQPPFWHVDLLNDGQPMTLGRVEFLSSAGRGCEQDMLGLVQDGRVTKFGLLPLYGAGWGSKSGMVPLSQALRRLARSLYSVHLAEIPLLGRDGRAYVLLANENHVQLLIGARDGVMQPLARLFWQIRNEIDMPAKP